MGNACFKYLPRIKSELFQTYGSLSLRGLRSHHQERPYLLYRLYFEGHQFDMRSQSKWIVRDTYGFLLQQGDITLIQEWIDTTCCFRSINGALFTPRCSETEQSLWQDKKVMRRQEILRIVALVKPIPRWALSIANKQITREATWPNWLSPHGADVVDADLTDDFEYQQVVTTVVVACPTSDRGLASGVNTSGLREVKEDDALEWSRTVQALSAQSTPWLDSDMLHIEGLSSDRIKYAIRGSLAVRGR